MKTLLFILLAWPLWAAPAKPAPAANAGQVQSAVRAAMPAYIAKAKISTDMRGTPARMVSVTVGTASAVPGWKDTWAVAGKVRLSNGSERSFEARVSTAGGVKVTDISLGF